MNGLALPCLEQPVGRNASADTAIDARKHPFLPLSLVSHAESPPRDRCSTRKLWPLFYGITWEEERAGEQWDLCTRRAQRRLQQRCVRNSFCVVGPFTHECRVRGRRGYTFLSDFWFLRTERDIEGVFLSTVASHFFTYRNGRPMAECCGAARRLRGRGLRNGRPSRWNWLWPCVTAVMWGHRSRAAPTVEENGRRPVGSRTRSSSHGRVRWSLRAGQGRMPGAFLAVQRSDRFGGPSLKSSSSPSSCCDPPTGTHF